jgi:hypothetical protein
MVDIFAERDLTTDEEQRIIAEVAVAANEAIADAIRFRTRQ